MRIKGPALQVVEPQCNACQSCMNLGCPALTWSEATFEGRHKVKIDASLCIGCTLCAQVCTADCIRAPDGAAAMTARRPRRPTGDRARARTHASAPVNVLIVGVGGQGVIIVSKVLAWLAQQRGYQVKQSEVHGMAKRGGSCSATCATAARCGRPRSRAARSTCWSPSSGPKRCAGCLG